MSGDGAHLGVRAVSLFSGAGGFEIGFERAGIQTLLQAESDPWCLEVLARHWPEVDRVDDVRRVCVREPAGRNSSDEFRPAVELGRRETGPGLSGGIDLVYGGWPCQGNSVAGKRAGLSDERSGLWHEARRVLSELRPRWFVGENVPGLLSVNRGADFLRVLMDLDDLGYGVAWRVLDARYFGVPQRRRRVFVVGCLGDAARAQAVLAVCESCGGHSQARGETGQDVAFTPTGGSPDTSRVRSHPRPGSNTAGNLTIAATLSGGGHSAGVNLPGRRHEDDENLIAFDWQTQGSSRTRPHANGEWVSPLKAKTQDAHCSAQGVRRLTPLECERLQGWGDDWTRWTADGKEIPDSHRYRMVGNGVAAPVVEWLGHRLVRANACMEVAA